MIQKILRFFDTLSITPFSWLAGFIALITARVGSEYFLEGYSVRSGEFLWFEWAHTFLFFLCLFLVFLPIFTHLFKFSFRASVNMLLFGFLITLLPIIVDFFVPVQGHFYNLKGLIYQYLTFYSGAPHVTVTYGAQIEIAIISLLLGLLEYWKTKRVLRACSFILLSYTVFFFFGTLASWIAIPIYGFTHQFSLPIDTEIAKIFLSPVTIFSYHVNDMIGSFNMRMALIFSVLAIPLLGVLAFLFERKKAFSVLTNVRLVQVLYHGGLFFIGGALASIFGGAKIDTFSFFEILATTLLLISIGCSWLASVITNDLYDQKIDVLTNPKRPLIRGVFTQQEYTTLGIFFFMASLFLATLVRPYFLVFPLAYQALAWIYSANPFRLKRFPVVSSVVAGCASLLILLLGYIFISPESSISGLPGSILLLLFVGYTLSLPIKDFKDINGDKKDRIYTIPVLFGETKGRIIIASGIFFSFVLSIWALNDISLTFWALFFGGTSFWVVATSHQWRRFRFHSRYLPLILFLFVTFYGIIITFKFLQTL